MGLRDRLRRAQERADKHFTTVVCSDCGQTFRAGSDIGLKVLVAGWQGEALEVGEVGEDSEPDPVVNSILAHPCESLVRAVVGEEWCP